MGPISRSDRGCVPIRQVLWTALPRRAHFALLFVVNYATTVMDANHRRGLAAAIASQNEVSVHVLRTRPLAGPDVNGAPVDGDDVA